MGFLGGPLSVRGFDLRGIGPSSDGNSLGGSLYWASGLHMYAPLPFKPGKGGIGDLFKTHMFLTAGNVGNFWLTGHPSRDLDQVTQFQIKLWTWSCCQIRWHCQNRAQLLSTS